MTKKYGALKVAELKALLKERDLPTDGIKQQLIQRLCDHDAAGGAEGNADGGGAAEGEAVAAEEPTAGDAEGGDPADEGAAEGEGAEDTNGEEAEDLLEDTDDGVNLTGDVEVANGEKAEEPAKAAVEEKVVTASGVVLSKITFDPPAAPANGTAVKVTPTKSTDVADRMKNRAERFGSASGGSTPSKPAKAPQERTTPARSANVIQTSGAELKESEEESERRKKRMERFGPVATPDQGKKRRKDAEVATAGAPADGVAKAVPFVSVSEVRVLTNAQWSEKLKARKARFSSQSAQSADSAKSSQSTGPPAATTGTKSSPAPVEEAAPVVEAEKETAPPVETAA